MEASPTSFWPNFPDIIKLPDNIKKGMASRGKLWVGWKIFITAMLEGIDPNTESAAQPLMTRE
ncbi:hypothetical protein HCU01_39620 [Halomonas cupida]|uniref:Uncharacterized protein n=1 Tax=Halomonas cupida TaxID=44933 RepID=A0ABQ0WKV5_9GAMM|nr:hypothetical protein HCU01_39620 [Halomonas cupida]